MMKKFLAALRESWHSRTDEFRFKAKLWSYFIIGLALLGWPEIIGWPFASRLVPDFSHEIGMALIIAPILAALVDEAAKSRMLREFGISSGLVLRGGGLPATLRSYIAQYLESAFVRTRWDVTYDITEWPNHPDYVRLVTHSEFELENRTDRARDYSFRYNLEESFFPDIGRARITSCRADCQINPNNDHFCYPDPHDANFQPHFDQTASVWTLSRVVRSIPPYEHSRYKFVTESEECIPVGSTIPFFVYAPVLRTTLNVRYPADKMEVVLDLPFADIDQDADLTTNQDWKRWSLKKAILPGQGFTLRLSKRQTATRPLAAAGTV